MSDMVANRGIIKEVYPELELEDKVAALIKDGVLNEYNIDRWTDGRIDYIDHNDYALIGDRVFNISNARTEYEAANERYNIKRVSPNELDIDLYYYNGGTDMAEIVADFLIDEKISNTPEETVTIPKSEYEQLKAKAETLGGL